MNPYLPWFPLGSMGLFYLDMLSRLPTQEPLIMPTCFKSNPLPQDRAENCCDDCAVRVDCIPAMYAGAVIDPGPAGFGDAWLQDRDASDSLDLTRFKLVYLGSPYTKYAAGIEQAFRDVSAIAAEMLRDGVRVYSPIAHTHPIAVYGNLDPLNHEIWLPFDQAMMDAAEAMVVADMSGWRESYGVKYEIDYFRAAGKPVYFRSADGTVDKLR